MRRSRRRLAVFAPFAATLVWIGVALGSGGSHVVKGGLYEGSIGGTGSPGGAAQETLTVSRNGREVSSVIVLAPQCGQPGGPNATVRNVKIVNGSFTARYPHIPTRHGVFDQATLTGHFLSHRRVGGHEDVRSNDTINGSLCKYSLPLKANAEPAGTKACANHSHAGVEFFDILVSGTTCAVADKAADKGKFTQPGGPTSTRVFSTPGWACRVIPRGLDNHSCTRSHPKATFSFSAF